MSMKKYNREQTAFYDKLQTKLGSEGITPNNFKFAYVPVKDELQGKTLFCPFCLTSTKFENFKYVKGELLECQVCKNRMRGKTLAYLSKIGMSEFAKWVYDYRINGFWEKVGDYKQWYKKLKILGLYDSFNENYKRIKGENKQYEDE